MVVSIQPLFSDRHSPNRRGLGARYEAKYARVPDALATLGYDATNLMLATIEKPDRDSTVAAAMADFHLKPFLAK
jgi:ABC-type branched-subunit amino acid transport system substrate-binding protein